MYGFEDQVAQSATKLSGGAGPCHTDGVHLRHWLLYFETQPEALWCILAFGLSCVKIYCLHMPYTALSSNTGQELATFKEQCVCLLLREGVDVLHISCCTQEF